MENKKKIAPIVITAIVVLALAAFSIIPVSAPGNPGAGCTCDTKLYGTIDGGVYFEQQGWAQFNSMTKTFNSVPSGIKEARVYTGFWQGSPGKGGYFNITVNTHTTDTYRACDPCPQATGCAPYQPCRCDALNASPGVGTCPNQACIDNLAYNLGSDRVNINDRIVGCGVQFVSFNATPYITPGTNTITVKTQPCSDCCRGGWDGRIYLIALLVVYEDSSMPEITYWVNEGALYLEKGSDCDGPEDHLYASKYFNGTHVSSPTNVKLWSFGYPHVINTSDSTGGWTKFNDCYLDPPDITESYAGGYNEVLLRWNSIPTSCLSDTSNFLQYHDPEPLYERAFVEALIVQGPSDKPDLTVTDIKFPTVMRPGQSYTITATVKNQGDAAAGPFNVSLDAEKGGTNYYSSKVHRTGLGIDASTDVDFTNVNLPAGCYNFTVVADCDGQVDELDENNNEEEECYQVGNVIVVSGNSELMSHPDFTERDGVYYLEGKTITNCAGDGIYIENTDVPFVISDCVVYDCGVPTCCNKPGNGMLFKNVVNGKVNDSEVRGNTLKGIKMANCSYMVIEDNYVHDNWKYGIDVYMEAMPTVDSHNITITNNTLVRNYYGIELLCHNCTVRDNLILNSTAWAGGEEGWGIYVSGNDSKIYNNTIKWSDSYGIKMDNTWIPTYRNCIVGNNFIENNQLHAHASQAFDNGVNYWNTTEPVGYYYPAPYTSHTNCTGNYWSDYTGSDPDGDGIGNTPYSIDGGTKSNGADHYPLIAPTWYYTLVMCGDVVPDDDVNPADVTRLSAYVARGIPCTLCPWAGDVVAPYGEGQPTPADVTRLSAHVARGIPCNCVIVIDGVIIAVGCSCPGFEALLAIAAIALIASFSVWKRNRRRKS